MVRSLTAGKGGTVSVTVLFCGDGEREGVQEDKTRDEVNFEPIFEIYYYHFEKFV